MVAVERVLDVRRAGPRSWEARTLLPMRAVPASPTLLRPGKLPRITHATRRATVASTCLRSSLPSAASRPSRSCVGSRPACLRHTRHLAASASSRAHVATASRPHRRRPRSPALRHLRIDRTRVHPSNAASFTRRRLLPPLGERASLGGVTSVMKAPLHFVLASGARYMSSHSSAATPTAKLLREGSVATSALRSATRGRSTGATWRSRWLERSACSPPRSRARAVGVLLRRGNRRFRGYFLFSLVLAAELRAFLFGCPQTSF